MDFQLLHDWYGMRAVLGFAIVALFVAGVVVIGAARQAADSAHVRHSAKAVRARSLVDPLGTFHA